MKTIIAGSRTITDYALVEQAVMDSGFEITEVVSGKEPKGVDRLGEMWADFNCVPVKPFQITQDDWKTYGRSAGPIRNKEMAEYAEALILVWDGKSRGSQSMLAIAKKLNLKIFEKVQK
jgi:hypothetical protein